MDAITLADAMELFKLPRTLGATAEGEPIVANVGRFGPYVKYGAKYASLKEDDPYEVTLERALEVIRLKKEADANRIIQDFPDQGIQVLNGRYGPYITDRKKNAKIPKERDPKTLTLEDCQTLLAAAPERGGRFGRWGRKKTAAPAAAGAAAAAPGEAPAASAAGRKKRAAKSAAPAQPPAAQPREASARAKVAARVSRKGHAAAKTVRKAAVRQARPATKPNLSRTRGAK